MAEIGGGGGVYKPLYESTPDYPTLSLNFLIRMLVAVVTWRAVI